MSDLTAEVRAALAAATPGLWVVEVDDWTCAVVLDDGLSGTAYIAERLTQGDSEGEDDANLIANAPSWLAALCDRLDAAEAKLAAAKAALSPHTTEAHGCTCTECQIARILNGDPNA